MGMFSFKTADSQEIITISCFTKEPIRTVYLLLPNGQQSVSSFGYDGYGRIGDINALAWLAKMNMPGLDIDLDDEDLLYSLGVDLICDFEDGETQLEYPLKLSFNPDAVYEKINGYSTVCSLQDVI